MRDLYGELGQIGYVVDDLVAAAQGWYEITGIGPWRIHEAIPLDHLTYNGAPTPAEIGIASAYSGLLQIELIAQYNDAPSMYRELRDSYGEGAQHVCFYPDDYDRALDHAVRNGMTVGQEGAISGIRFVYLRGHGGRVIELADLPRAVRNHQREAAARSQDWDGADPIQMV